MIYFDNAATTPTFPECAEILKEYSCNSFYNPSALYDAAVEVSVRVRKARAALAGIIGATEDELYFTASGTEADNTLMLGAKKRKGANIVISAIEHNAVLQTAIKLQNLGFELRVAPVDSCGVVIEEEFYPLIDQNTCLVSVIHVNNETGGVNDVARLAQGAKKINPNLFFMSDGVQAFCKVKINLNATQIDGYTLAGHKICAPKGVAAFYLRKGVHIAPLMQGGQQEKGIRPSTENVAAIIAFAEAARLFRLRYAEYNDVCKRIKTDIIEYVQEAIPEVIINSGTVETVDNILSLAFPDINSEILLHLLEKEGILTGVGSACSSHKKEKRVANALGLSQRYANGLLRLSFGMGNTAQDAATFISVLEKCYKQILK